METKKWHGTDKSTWGFGPWQDKETGLPCLIVRNRSGALCGYVGVERVHPWYAKEYSEKGPREMEVHGGLTFASKCTPPHPDFAEHRRICHIPSPGESDDIWWFGFDCAHAWDLSPGRTPPDFASGEDVYRNIEYVKIEVAELARQLRDIG